MTVHGTPKPAYRAFELLHGAGMERVAVAGTCPCYTNDEICDCGPLSRTDAAVASDAAAPGSSGGAAAVTRCTDTLNNTAGGILATKNATTLRLFLYNHPVMSSTSGMDCEMTVELPADVSSPTHKRSGGACDPVDISERLLVLYR